MEETYQPVQLKQIDKNNGFGFWKKIIFIVLFFTVAPATLLASLISLESLSFRNTKNEPPVKLSYVAKPLSGVQIFASLPQKAPSVSGEVIESDARVEVTRQYLEANKSELTPYAALLVETADKYGLDWRLLTAIAQKESGLCNVIPDNSYNCWGWGIHSRGTLRFDSYNESIEAVSRGLRDNYANLGYVTVPEIMSKWIPHSPGGAWADDVLGYMTSISNYSAYTP